MNAVTVRTWRIGIAVLVVLAMAAAGCGGSGSSATAGSNPSAPVTIKFGLFGALSDAGLFIAKDKGYFKQQHITIDFVKSPDPAQAISLVASGSLDAAGISPSPGFFNAIARGVKVRLLADKGQIGPGHSWVGVVVRKDLFDSGQIKTLSDLKGRKVGSTGVVSSTGAEFAKALQQAGVALSDVKLQQAANPADTLTALSNKAIDAAVLQEPFITLAKVMNVGHELTPLGPVLPNGQNGAIAVGAKLAGEPDVLSRFMTAYRKGIADYRAAFPAPAKKGPDEAAIAQILIKNTPVKKPALYDQMEPVQFSPSGRVDTASIDFFQHFFIQQKLQNKFVPASQYLINVPKG